MQFLRLGAGTRREGRVVRVPRGVTGLGGGLGRAFRFTNAGSTGRAGMPVGPEGRGTVTIGLGSGLRVCFLLEVAFFGFVVVLSTVRTRGGWILGVPALSFGWLLRRLC